MVGLFIALQFGPQAKLLQEMDEEFGVGDLVAEEMKTERRHVYGTKDLKGLRVEHDLVI